MPVLLFVVLLFSVADALRLALTQLTPRQREVLELRFVEGLSSPQIAERLRLRCPPGMRLLNGRSNYAGTSSILLSN